MKPWRPHHLTHKGYEILERNWRHDHAEIDIICKANNTIIFVEVKTRTSKYFGHPEEAVTETKQNLLQKAAQHYLESNSLANPIRFDIFSIVLLPDKEEIYHIQGALFPHSRVKKVI